MKATIALMLTAAAILFFLASQIMAVTSARHRLREREEAERRLDCILRLAEAEPAITVAAAQFTCTPYRP